MILSPNFVWYAAASIFGINYPPTVYRRAAKHGAWTDDDGGGSVAIIDRREERKGGEWVVLHG